jgi:integrase
MAIKINVRLLGKMVTKDDGTFLVRLGYGEPKTFRSEKEARTHLEKYAERRYDVAIFANGRLKRKTFKRKKDAEDYQHRQCVDVNDGTYREIRKTTFGEYAAHWQKTHLHGLKPSTLNGYLAYFPLYYLPAFEHTPMQAISPAEINSFKSSLAEKGLSNGTQRNVLFVLGKLFKDGVKDSRLRYSPMASVELPKKSSEKKGRALKPAEIQKLLANCEESDDRDTHLIVMTAILTGMRRGEVFGLRWEDVDFANDVIHVRQALYWKFGKHIRPKEGDVFVFTTPKSKTSAREIDLSPSLKKALRQKYLTSPKKGLVFSGEEGRPRDPNNFLKREFRDAVAAAELGSVRFHDLRHTYGSMKIEQGENIYYVQRQMGHSSIQVTIDVYGHLLESRKPEAAAKTDTLLFGSAKKAEA